MKVISVGGPQGYGPGLGAGRRVAYLAVLLSLALILQLVESSLPPLGLPGMKLGLANTVILLTLWLWTWREAFTLVILRQMIGGLLTGKFLSAGFYLGLAGGLASIAVMLLWQRFFGRRRELVSTSIAGAMAHNWGQWLAALWLINHQAILWYLPFLTLAALPCGFLVAALARPLVGFFGQEQPTRPVVSPVGVACLLVPLLVAVVFPVYADWAGQPAASMAVVQVGGVKVEEINLARPGEWEIESGDHRYTVVVQDGGIKIARADCPDQICVQTGLIKHRGQAIVCVPGQLIITLVNQGGTDAYLP